MTDTNKTLPMEWIDVGSRYLLVERVDDDNVRSLGGVYIDKENYNNPQNESVRAFAKKVLAVNALLSACRGVIEQANPDCPPRGIMAVEEAVRLAGQ